MNIPATLFVNMRKVRNLYWRNGGYYFAKMVDGARTWVNLHTKDETEAIARIGSLDLNTRNLATSELPLSEEIDRFLAHAVRMNELREFTAQGYRSGLLEFARSLPKGTTIESVTFNMVNGFYNQLRARKGRFTERSLAESTVRTRMAFLSTFMKWAVEQRLRVDNPTERIVWPKFFPVARKDWVDTATANALIRDAPNNDMRFVLFMGFHAGLRRNEIMEARRDWFNLDGGYMEVRLALKAPRLRQGERLFRTKNGKERSIPLTPAFRKFLVKFLKKREPSDFAVRPEVKHGNARWRWDFHWHWVRYMKTKRCSHITPHIMRHSFASNLATLGESIYKIAVWMGDEVRTVHENYAKLAPGSGGMIHKLGVAI